jgi:hypothetical protein
MPDIIVGGGFSARPAGQAQPEGPDEQGEADLWMTGVRTS